MSALLVLASCLSADDPRTFPVRIEVDFERPGLFWALDIDGDGRDEAVGRMLAPGPIGEPGPTSALLFIDDDDVVLDQTNYDGLVLKPWAADVMGDAAPEVLAPLQRHDSLFMSVANNTGQKIASFLIMTGGPRIEPDGALPWDPQVMDLWTRDLDGDGTPELVTSVSTAYARAPRGVMVHDLPDGQLVGSSMQGTGGPLARLLADFDHDGDPEMLVATMKTMHGARSPGFDDSHTYLLHYELVPKPRLAWSQERNGVGFPKLAMHDFDGDGDDEILFAEIQDGSGFLEMQLLTPGTWSIERRRTITHWFDSVLLVDLDLDSRVELLASGPSGLTVFDGSLEPVRTVSLPAHVAGMGEILPDADGDGINEILYPLGSGFVLLSPDLRIKARYSSGTVVAVENRGLGRVPRLLIHVDGATRFATLRRNPAYPLYRYGGYGTLVALAVVITFAFVPFRNWYEWQRLARITGPSSPPDAQTLVALNRRGHVLWSDPSLGPLRHSKAGRPATVTKGTRDFVQSVTAAIESLPVREHTIDIHVPTPDGPAERGRIRIIPIRIGGSGDPYWIVRRPAPASAPNDEPWAWPMMAQRIAHSLKQPLTHMLLTVQRLQAEYRERAPGIASRLDPYADRIENGISQLRHHTSSFLKLVDLAEPELARTNVSDFVAGFIRQRSPQLPPDIRLQGDMSPDVVAVVDVEQLQVALDNLVANAVDAMDQGGVITISVAVMRAVKVAENDGHRDYAVIEVLDTGKGIPEEQRSRIFEPGFSTAHDGSGLGLAIVRKIVEDHGGHVSFESSVGVGSVFTVHLPCDGPVRPRVMARESSDAGA